MKSTLAVLTAVVLLGAAIADQPGCIGLFLDDSDFRIVHGVAKRSPAAQAGIQAGDRIVSIDGCPASKLHKAAKLQSRVGGAAGTTVVLELQHKDTSAIFTVRIDRVPADTIDFRYRRAEMIYKDGHVEVIEDK